MNCNNSKNSDVSLFRSIQFFRSGIRIIVMHKEGKIIKRFSHDIPL